MKYDLVSIGFTSWQPSTWPEPPASYVVEFSEVIKKIIEETILNEIGNVVSDAQIVNKGLQHRGHVVILALLCAIDSVSAYAFSDIVGKGSVGKRYKKFISVYFPSDYHPFSTQIYKFYRNSSVHSWNLFQVGISPGDEPISLDEGILSVGLINFYEALKEASGNFLLDLKSNPVVQTNTLKRYFELKQSAQGFSN